MDRSRSADPDAVVASSVRAIRESLLNAQQDGDAANRIATAAAEILVNAVEHGSATRFSFELAEQEDPIQCIIEDNGASWNPDHAPRHVPGTPRGHGIAMARLFCDISWSPLPEGGNRTVLTLRAQQADIDRTGTGGSA